MQDTLQAEKDSFEEEKSKKDGQGIVCFLT